MKFGDQVAVEMRKESGQGPWDGSEGALLRTLCTLFQTQDRRPRPRQDPKRLYFLAQGGTTPLPKGSQGHRQAGLQVPLPAVPGILWLQHRWGEGLHVILGHQAVEVRACAVVAGAKVRDVHLANLALSQRDPTCIWWS